MSWFISDTHNLVHVGNSTCNFLICKCSHARLSVCCNVLLEQFQHFWFLSGVGYATQVIVALLNIYYIVVLAWAIFFLSNCFTWDLPWASCNNTWNTSERHHLLHNVSVYTSLWKKKKLSFINIKLSGFLFFKLYFILYTLYLIHYTLSNINQTFAVHNAIVL